MTTGRHPRIPPDLAETIDECEPVRPVPEAIDRMVYEEDFAKWEWAEQLKASIAAANARAQQAESAVHTTGARLGEAEKKLARAEKIIYSGTGLIGVGVVAVVKLAFFAGGESNAAQAREAERIETRAAVGTLQLITVPALRADIAATSREIADLRGELRAISRLGAVRVQGPAPRPLLNGDHDP